nr:transcription activator GLK2-like isoform X3 [Ipomoea trifida]
MSDIQPKPRFKWTPDLHHRFYEAIQFLGGVQCKGDTMLFRSAAYLSCRVVVKLPHSSSHFFCLVLAILAPESAIVTLPSPQIPLSEDKKAAGKMEVYFIC